MWATSPGAAFVLALVLVLVVVVVVVGIGWLRRRSYRTRLEANAKLCFLLFQCLENAAASTSSLPWLLRFPLCLPVLPRSFSWLSRFPVAVAVATAAALQLQFSRIRICSKQIYMEDSVRAEFINAAP